MKITNIRISNPGKFTARIVDGGYNLSAQFPLYLIRMAWEAGCNFENEADGFGAGLGTMGDWSGIRDSSDAAQIQMLEKAMNFIAEKVAA